ncbi:hypothetical protein PAXINDRAFT_17203 [Paxillus involutus ATCC 200175]|uniref:KOW domain-containing protein n=1 Tax=Paxillus involutus ATCC 200175 TaxID=664439 RepID=A0A0C9TRF6_PAXIN|nr:hypothetical protein PAXINDRAFT_17203 [Paxillus involutus ATCC 200175]
MSDNVQNTHASRPLVEDRSAWHLVMQWAEEQIQFPLLCDTLAEQFGNRYVYADWKHVFDAGFTASEDGRDACIAAVRSAMDTSISHLSTNKDDQPSASTSASGHHAELSLKSQGKRRKLDSGDSPRRCKRVRPSVHRFLDLEAQQEDNEEETTDDEEQDPFVVPDGTIEDGPVTLSRALDYLDAIAERFEDSTGDRSEDLVSDDEDTIVLDTTGIWEMIRDWITDFQYGKYPKIQYWEDFISDLAFNRVDELAHYVYPVILRPVSAPPPLPSVSPASPPSQDETVTKMWFVRIIPASSASYIASMWNKAGLAASEHKLLRGRVTVSTLDPSTFLHALPPSHPSSVHSYSLVPAEEYVRLFGVAAHKPQVPGWYKILKRGTYKGDLGYALSYNAASGCLDILLASRNLPDPTCRDRDDKIGQDQKARCLFKPELHGGAVQPSIRGMACYSYKRHTYISGLLLLQLTKTQVEPVLTPSPHQIALHVGSMVDPAFMAATHARYNRQFWKERDGVLVCDAAHRGKRGFLLTITMESQSATVQLLEGGEYIVPLSDLQCHHVVGDVVRVIEDPHSDLRNIHHQAIGKFGNVSHIDFDTDEITFMDSMGEIRVPSFLLESYVPDQRLWTPFSSLSPSVESPTEDIQSGDIADVVAGPHVGVRGAVTSVHHLAGTVQLSPLPPHLGPPFNIQRSSVTFTPHPQALKFSHARGYDIRLGDHVVVVRGDGVGKTGVVSQVDLDKKVLKVAATWNPSDVFTLPITRFTRSDAFRNREDENQCHRSKEVLIIGGHYKGWRGSLVSVGKDTCVVARGNSSLGTFETSVVVVRGERATLNGILLTPAQSIEVSDAFAQGERPEVVNRQCTPPPELPSQPVASSSFTPWSVDGDDIAGLNAPTPTSAFDFLRHPSVAISLQRYRAVFKIKPGWKDTYANRHAKTEVPDPFQSPSGRAPSGHIAVCFTARTKGATLLHETIPERCLEPVAPPQKNTFCMVISSKEGGEGIGTILAVKKTSTKEKQVTVVRLDGTPAAEQSLPWDRVIMVERPS